MHRTIFLTAILISIGCSNMQPESRDIQIDTPEGTVHAKESQIDALPQKITPVEGDELRQLASIPSNSAFVEKYVPNVINPTLVDYDDAFLAWRSDTSGEYANEDVVMIIGGYLGNRCIADFDMEWVRVEDEYGTDFGVRAKQSEVMIFPFSSVQKRVDDQGHGFVYGVYHAVRDLLDSGKADSRSRG